MSQRLRPLAGGNQSVYSWPPIGIGPSADHLTPDWQRWYREHIPIAERLYNEYTEQDEE
jgi:hypothetical protein